MIHRAQAASSIDDSSAPPATRLRGLLSGYLMTAEVFGTNVNSRCGRFISYADYVHHLDCSVLREVQIQQIVHTGHHTDFLRQVAYSQEFANLMSNFLTSVQRLPRREHLVGISSVHGQHRSVSAALLLQYVFQQLCARWTNRFLEERSGGWRELCHGCPRCDDNSEDDEIKRFVLQRAQRLLTAT